MPDSHAEFRPSDERWKAIQRTQKKMSAPPGGEDMGALLAQSMEAYWAQGATKTSPDIEWKNPQVYRKAAEAIRPALGASRWDVLRGLLSSIAMFWTFRAIRSWMRDRKAAQDKRAAAQAH
jgi:hypothetical protein